MDSDARNLTIAINLRYVLDCRSDAISQHRLKTYRKKCKIVTEIQDPKSEIVLAENSSVRKTGSFVFTSASETGVFALAISCKAIYDLFTKLIDPATNTGHVVADLSGRVMNRCSGTLLGWRRSDERHPVLNPGNKDQPLPWQSQAADELIILLPASQAGLE
ncbi:SRR1 [Symbiodinium pilosum]|uniref:SRR1 protein n=1 Tax=Symbiodinium pilosum TaxID=2952 RepID=A0A812MK74_SYMPI|nr:SRR1 [Symbiodinium pilosum]